MQVEKADIEELQKVIKKNYEANFSFENFNVYQSKEGKIYITSKEIDIKLAEASVRAGIYFGKIKRNDKILLSTEGSQLIGKYARKNIAILDKKNLLRFIEGFEAKPERIIGCEEHNFVLVTNGEDFFGSGLFIEGKVKSFVPKERRIYMTLKKL